MEKIMPVSDLRNYNQVLQYCDAGGIVHLTKNGRGRYIVATEDYFEKMTAIAQLMSDLQEGENSVKSEKDWITLEESRKMLGVD